MVLLYSVAQKLGSFHSLSNKIFMLPGPASVTVKALAFRMGGLWFDSRQRQNPFLCEYRNCYLYTLIISEKPNENSRLRKQVREKGPLTIV